MSERALEPLEMSDTEIIDFISNECARLTFNKCWTIDGHSFQGMDFRRAVRMSAAYDKEANG